MAALHKLIVISIKILKIQIAQRDEKGDLECNCAKVQSKSARERYQPRDWSIFYLLNNTIFMDIQIRFLFLFFSVDFDFLKN